MFIDKKRSNFDLRETTLSMQTLSSQWLCPLLLTTVVLSFVFPKTGEGTGVCILIISNLLAWFLYRIASVVLLFAHQLVKYVKTFMDIFGSNALHPARIIVKIDIQINISHTLIDRAIDFDR